MGIRRVTNFMILAAGKGTRMESDLPKVMHEVSFVPMIDVLLNKVQLCNPQNISVVISEEGKLIKDAITCKNVSFVLQRERLGTGHAVKIAWQNVSNIEKKDILIVLYGDTPFVSKETIEKLQNQISDGNAVSVVGFVPNGDNQYGRLVTENDSLTEIVEYKDASLEQKKIKLCNSGVMAFDVRYVDNLLSQITANNAKGEYYLTDVVGFAVKSGLNVSYIQADEEEVQGINNKIELSHANEYYFDVLRNKAINAGVTLVDPKTIYLADDVRFGKNVVIEPNVVVKSGVIIGNNVLIKSFSYLDNAKIGDNSNIGPFARLRPGTEVKNNVNIGNFVEIKNSKISEYSKVNHLSYVGDAEIKENVNIGAGTITCNYDGYNKYKTIIEKEVFVGSNTSLVAPVNVGEKSIIGAGSTITRDIQADSITVGRAIQKDITGAAKKYHKKRTNT